MGDLFWIQAHALHDLPRTQVVLITGRIGKQELCFAFGRIALHRYGDCGSDKHTLFALLDQSNAAFFKTHALSDVCRKYERPAFPDSDRLPLHFSSRIILTIRESDADITYMIRRPDVFRKLPVHRKVIAFGSYARGTARLGSDLDLLVVLPSVEDKRETAIAMRRVLADLPVPHDVFVTTPEEIEERGWIIGTVLREALRDGVVVYKRREGE